jgi:hypothetical protein
MGACFTTGGHIRFLVKVIPHYSRFRLLCGIPFAIEQQAGWNMLPKAILFPYAEISFQWTSGSDGRSAAYFHPFIEAGAGNQ